MSVSSARSRSGETPALSSPAREHAREIVIAGVTLVADPAGALYWPEEKLLVAADLHLEKGSAYAARGVLLPPYDTAATLARLARLIERYVPRLVVALGDSFHDGGGPARMAEPSRVALSALQRGRDWVWLAGNHDPDPAENIGGRFAAVLALGALTFRHEPQAGDATARSPVICIRSHAWRGGDARFGGAASRATGTASSCRRSDPMPAASMCATAPLRHCLARCRSRRICWASVAALCGDGEAMPV